MSDVDVIYAAPGARVCVKGYRGRRVGWLGHDGGLETSVLHAEVLELPPYPVERGVDAIEVARRVAEGTGMELVKVCVWGPLERPAIGALYAESD